MQNTSCFKYIQPFLISKKLNISRIFRLVLLLCFVFCVHPAIAGTFTEDSLQIAAYYEKVQSGDSAGARDWLFVLSNNPDDELARKANFLLAKTTFDAGDFDGALEAIALGVPELLNDWGTYLKALAYLEVGRPTDAAESFWDISEDTTSSLAEEGLWRLSALTLEKGYIDSTIRLTNRYRVWYPDGVYRQEIELLKASALILLKEYEAAVECLYRAELMGPTTEAGKEAELKRLSMKQLYGFEPRKLSAAEIENRLIALQEASASNTAVLWIEELSAGARASELEEILLYYKGTLLSRRGNQKDALAIFQEHQRKFPRSVYADDVLYNLGRSAYLRSLDNLAIASLTMVTHHQKNFPRVLDAQKLLGVLHADAGDLKSARTEFRKLVKLAEGHPAFSDALWQLGWVYFDMSQFSKAENTWEQLWDLGEDTDYAAAALYWRGRCFEKMNKPARAQEFFDRTRTLFPNSYYSLWVASKLPKDTLSELDWGASPLMTFSCVTDSIHSQHLEKLCLLEHLKLPKLALREWPYVKRDIGESPGLWWKRASLLDATGDDAQAWLVIRNHLRRYLSKADKRLPDRLWRIAYPVDFDDIIKREAEARKLDSHFVLGLICQESRFHAEIASGAGAIGLMQLMPPTAKRVAQQMDTPYSRAKLTEPTYNVALGTAYLAGLFEEFCGDSILVLAAYNAGESAAQSWDAEFGGDADVLVEHIPYRETRMFVKYVLQHIAAYRRLYPEL